MECGIKVDHGKSWDEISWTFQFGEAVGKKTGGSYLVSSEILFRQVLCLRGVRTGGRICGHNRQQADCKAHGVGQAH